MNGIELKLRTSVNGNQWNLYGIDYETADGKFSTYIYALSDEHAQLICQELRETANVSGRIFSVFAAGEGI